MVERALAASDAAEVEANDRKVAVGERIVEVVDDLVVHRAAELRVRVQHDGDRGVLLTSRMVATLDPSTRTGKDNLGHEPPRMTQSSAANTSPTARLTEAMGARNYLEPF